MQSGVIQHRARATRLPSRKHGAEGVTFLELIVAISLAIVLSFLIYGVIVSQSRAYAVQDQMTVLQQNLRFSMDFISRNLAMAGYGTSGYTLVAPTIDSTGSLLAIRAMDGGSTAADSFQVVYADPTRLAMTSWGYNQGCGTSTLTFQNTTDVSNFSEASALLCFDFSDSTRMKSFIFPVTAIDTTNGTVSITPPTGNTDYYGTKGQCPAGENLPRDLQCGQAQVLTFYLDKVDDSVGPGSPSHPTLMMSSSMTAFSSSAGVTPSTSDVSLADNIEDLQLEVCKGEDLSCGTSDYTAWSSAYNAASAQDEIRQIRITLVARSDRKHPEGRKTGVDPYTGSTDGYIRRNIKTTVLLRNLKLLGDYNQ